MQFLNYNCTEITYSLDQIRLKFIIKTQNDGIILDLIIFFKR